MAHILVVDDDDETRATLRYILEDAGHTVSEAREGEAALDWLRTEPTPAVVVLDNLMPTMDGATLLEAVRADAVLTRQRAFILLTASPQHVTTQLEALLAEMDVPVVRKPFDLTQFLDVVAQAVASVDATS